MSSCLNSEIKAGDLLAWSGSRPFAKLVRIFTMSEFTHVGIAVVENDEVYVIEAIAPKVRKVKLGKRVPFYHIPMNVVATKKEMDYLHSLIGAKYSYVQAVLSFFGIYIDDNRWYCTELAYEFYDRLGLNFSKKLTPTKFINQAIKKFNKHLIYIESV